MQSLEMNQQWPGTRAFPKDVGTRARPRGTAGTWRASQPGWQGFALLTEPVRGPFACPACACSACGAVVNPGAAFSVALPAWEEEVAMTVLWL